jgi:hypothetical protein
MKRFVVGLTNITLLFFGAVCVSSCGSFNNSFNTYTITKAKPDATPKKDDGDDEDEHMPLQINIPSIPPPEATPVVSSKPKGKCEVTPYYAMPRPPEIPSKALQAAHGVAEIEAIERKHIDDLRAYISDIRKQHRKTQMNFYEKCDVISK